MVYRNLISDGSSSMVVNQPTGFMEVYVATSSRRITALHNLAVSGSVLADLINRLSSVTSNLNAGWNGMVCLIGANDLIPATLAASHGNSVTQWSNDVIANYLTPLAAIVRPILCTTLQPRNVAGFNTNRNLGNPLIRGWVTSGYIDGVIDFAADPVMGPDAACSDTSLYSDGTHPTQLGSNLDSEIIKTYLDRFVPGDVIGRMQLRG